MGYAVEATWTRGEPRRRRETRVVLRVAAALAVAVATAGGVSGQEVVDEAGGGQSGFRTVVFPDAEFYRQYVADPGRSQSAMILQRVSSVGIESAGDARFLLRLGGRFALLRWHPAGEPDRGWQLDFEGGFFGQFDIDNSLDNIGWDGLYGLLLSYKPTPDVGFRVGMLHDSPHVGDEYAERTERRRLDATREELAFGASWRPVLRWRVYGEAGYAVGLEPFQEPLRLQTGIEWRGERRFWRRATWYGALDLTGYEETDWQPRAAVQVGLMVPTGRGTGRYRFAVEVTDGRSVLGEFLFDEETAVGVGWYFDF